MLSFLVAFLVFGLSLAQRPANTSTCDYYTQLRYGENTNVTQYQLVQGIVTLAFGGRFNFSDVPTSLTGIMNPGSLNGLPVDLQPWFNGSIPSTNLNNQAVAIDWMDGGGLDPLYSYLNNETSTVVLSNATNQYRLFDHFFLAFSHIFGCSHPPPSTSTGGQLSLAYVHKYMNLNYTDLGHFIDQLSQATTYYGFSTQDSTTFSNNMNSEYNVRCAPPITTNPSLGPQLLSLCQADTCPLAVPNPDCGPYMNLTADSGSSSAGSSSISPSSEPTVVPSSSVPAATSTAPAGASSSAASSGGGGGSSFGGGAIAGTVIGGLAVLLLGVGLIIWCLRRQKHRNRQEEQQLPPPAPAQPPMSHDPHSSMGYLYGSGPPTHASSPSPRPQHISQFSYGQYPVLAEMETPHEPLGEMESPKPIHAPSPVAPSPRWENARSPTAEWEQGYIQSVERGGHDIK